VFTGGCLLYGAVGRTDLVSPEQTEQLTRARYRSVRRLAAELPDEVAVYPTRGPAASARPPRPAEHRLPSGTNGRSTRR
jgi:glyoxylase-like metal-dependent hydrolase (beta-lactamase superfamily II)